MVTGREWKLAEVIEMTFKGHKVINKWHGSTDDIWLPISIL